MKKKITALILACVMLLCMMPVTALPITAEEAGETSPTPSEGLAYTYNSSENGYTVTGIGTCTDSAVVIPSTYEGKPVVGIGGYAFARCNNVTSIVIPDSVTYIGQAVFFRCSGLESITVDSGNTVFHSAGNCVIKTATKTLVVGCKNSVIPKDGSVTDIGNFAFCGCTGLTSIEIPDSVSYIGMYVFENCADLTSIDIPAGMAVIGDGSFSGCESLSQITVDNGNPYFHSEGNCLIYTSTKKLIAGCKNSVIPSDGSVTSIVRSAFSGCTGLTSIEIPDSVTLVGNYAFYGCKGLTSIEIPDSVTSIGEYAFDGCAGLTDVTFGSSLTSIGDYAFSGCEGMTSIELPDGLTSIGEYAFAWCFGLTDIVIPGSVTSIGEDAFSVCKGLTSVTIENGVTYIVAGAFKGCTSLTSIEIPDSVTSIGAYAFYNCPNLKTVYNHSNLHLTAGSTENGHVAFYATQVYGHTYDRQNTDERYLATPATETARATYYYSCSCGAKGTETFEYGDILMLGDTNGDRVVDVKDLLCLRRYLAAIDPESGESETTISSEADVNGDGEITVKDVVLLRRYLVNINPYTGVSSVVLGK